MPPETSEINLSRALKVKNRMVNRLAQLNAILTGYNSRPEGNHEYDVREVYRERMVLAALLVRLKVAINAANHPVQALIYELSECKALIATLQQVNTQHGPTTEGYAGTRVTYVAQFRKIEIDKEIRRVEAEIDRIQDELDRFNHRTLITVETASLIDAPAT
jgi:hypothetical protein